MVGGWADGYTNAIPRLLAGYRGPRKGLIGPWAHEYPELGVPGPAIGFLQEALRWWDHWLKGRDTGIMDEPMLRVWMQEPVAPRRIMRSGRAAGSRSRRGRRRRSTCARCRSAGAAGARRRGGRRAELPGHERHGLDAGSGVLTATGRLAVRSA